MIDVDPAEKANRKQIDYDAVLKIAKECTSVCRAKYDLTFNGKKRRLYPIFSLVANSAPTEVIRVMFMENPFRLNEETDDNGWTLMHYACAYNPLPAESLEFLEKRNSHSLIAWDNQNRAPLHTACANLSPETDHVLFILEHSPPEIAATPDKDGKLPIDLAKMDPKCTNLLTKSLQERAKGVSPFSAEPSRAPPPEPVNTTDGVTATSTPTNPLEYKKTTETVGPQSWWERFCCVPRI